MDFPAFTMKPSRISPLITRSPGKSMFPTRRSMSPRMSSTSSTQKLSAFTWNRPSQAATIASSFRAVFLPGRGKATRSFPKATALPRTLVPIEPSCFGTKVASTSSFFTSVKSDSSLKSTRSASGLVVLVPGTSFSATTRTGGRSASGFLPRATTASATFDPLFVAGEDAPLDCFPVHSVDDSTGFNGLAHRVQGQRLAVARGRMKRRVRQHLVPRDRQGHHPVRAELAVGVHWNRGLRADLPENGIRQVRVRGTGITAVSRSRMSSSEPRMRFSRLRSSAVAIPLLSPTPGSPGSLRSRKASSAGRPLPP